MYMPNKKSNSKEYFANLLGSYFILSFRECEGEPL